MRPMILTTYNLPSCLCMKESSFMLTLLIPGPKSLGKDIDVYLRPLIEDLKFVWAEWKGYKACPTCNKDIPSVRVLSKIAYVGHKRLLKKPHKWRSLLEFNGQIDNRDPLKEFGWDEILAQLDRLPTHVKESSFMPTLLTPGPKSPGKDIDIYLRPLIDDLKDLWALKGVKTIDVATGQKVNMRAMVLRTINDFPTRGSLHGWSGQGYKACPTCNDDIPSMRVLGKTAYVGHRRFLKKPHK
nr:hypothetical protein [Tanacetum cinerariifolium]